MKCVRIYIHLHTTSEMHSIVGVSMSESLGIFMVHVRTCMQGKIMLKELEMNLAIMLQHTCNIARHSRMQYVHIIASYMYVHVHVYTCTYGEISSKRLSLALGMACNSVHSRALAPTNS